jgi:gluconokinase
MNSVVVMGVAGCGKSSLGAALANALGWTLVEGDDFHAESSKARMRDGVPLTDADRGDWLATLGRQLTLHPEGVVLTCSALKRRYREQLRASAPGLHFVYLELDQATARRRVAARAAEHLFPPTLVESQFAALEPPVAEPGVLALDATLAPAELVQRAVSCLRSAGSEG